MNEQKPKRGIGSVPISSGSVRRNGGLSGTCALALLFVSAAILGMRCQPNAAPFILHVAGDSLLNAGREYWFSAHVADVERDSISVRFDWGDGDTSSWSNYVESGDSTLASHVWHATGYMDIKFQSRDQSGATSNWVGERAIRVIDSTVVKWIRPVGDFSHWSEGSPAIADDGTIYVSCLDGLHAIDPDGFERWRLSAGYPAAPVIGPDSTIYFTQDSTYWGPLTAVNRGGGLEWTQYHAGITSPAIGVDGTVYCGAKDTLFAFRPNGYRRWAASTCGPAVSSPVIARDGTIYLAVRDTTAWSTVVIYAFDADSTVKWQLALDSTENTDHGPGIAIAEDGSIRYSGYPKVISINPDGTLGWKSPRLGWAVGQPAIGPDGVSYPVGSRCAINADGSVRWPANRSSTISTPAIDANNSLWLVGSSAGPCESICHLRTDGSSEWSMSVLFRTRGGWTAPAIGPDGTVYIGMDGCLYALRGGSGLASTGWPKYQHDLRNTGCSATPITPPEENAAMERRLR